jgi:hypothetical protein
VIYIPGVGKKIKQRFRQQLCNRCKLYFLKTEAECPKCKGISDVELEKILERRSKGRQDIGKLMLWSSITLAIVMILAIAIIKIQ